MNTITLALFFFCIVSTMSSPAPSLRRMLVDVEDTNSNQEFDHVRFLAPVDDWTNDSEEEEDDDDDDRGEELLSRKRRQVDQALDLALRHDKPAGRIHGRLDANGFGKNNRNYHVNYGAGLGTTLYKSKNGRHSLGVGAYAGQSRGRYEGYRYKSKPSYGVGLGYKFRF